MDLFAITGIETVGSYVARIKNPVRIVPKGITMAALLTSFAYIIGFVAMACIFSPSQISTDSLESLIAVVYAKAGTAWGFGPLYLRIIMLIYVLITVTAVILWLVSSVGVLFDTLPKGVISEKYSELKVNGIPLIGILFTGVMILLFLIISNSESSSNIYYTLYDMTTMAVLIPYLLVGISYIMFRKKGLKAKFQVTKNNNFAYIIGGFVVFITLVAIVFSAWDLTTPMSDRITWFILSAGGATFFILIGIALYLRTKSIHKSYFMLTCLFLVASFMFSKVILIFVVLILILWLINSRLEKNKI